MDREGKSYRHKRMNAVVLVVKSHRMSAGTTRHTLLVLDCDDPRRLPGSQSDVDEVPVEPFTRNWDEVG